MIDMQVDIFEYLEPSKPKVMNNILKVIISTPITLDSFKRETVSFSNVYDKEKHLSTLDIFSRNESQTGELETVVLNVDLFK